ncbi:hypothetical protein Pint_31041 [Pistacia integerrima]|uniref:Uncharacterized protein n=1 Tax=Pistacia integerrima TaxID=434235 RepID=A0ACC0XQR6_9ROSI|nr:hypothetical protein Pint_31041 [Pistacia integerrima]
MAPQLLSFANATKYFLLPSSENLLMTKSFKRNKTKSHYPFQYKPLSPKNPTTLITCSSVSNLSTPKVEKAIEEEDLQFEEEELEFEEEEKPLNEIWKEIQGSDNWEGLLDPMNSHLRREIIRYGEFAQACYDSFDFDPHSKYCGTCKYHGAHFFEKLHMANHGYQISRYLYATSDINLPNFFQKSRLSSVWSTHANWMGYIAVATDEEEVKRLGRRDIVVAWRGTVTYLEWIYDLKDILCSAKFTDDPSIKIELGFYDLYTKKEDSFYSFAGPRVGNLKFKERCDELGVKVLRVINVHDKVPTVPGILANEKLQFQKYLEDATNFPWSYAHVGVELALDHKHSPFLKDTKDFGCAHNLEALLHLVDGYHGKDKRFVLAMKRDIALVNKCCDFLKSEYGVPPHWRQDENKGMVRNSDGKWVLPERPRLEAHRPEDTAHHLKKILKRATTTNGSPQLGAV